MEWQAIKTAICDGRRFEVRDQECSVMSDVIMPSGGVIRVHIQPRAGELFMHDNGAAFDELARHGLDIKTLRGVRTMLRETRFRMGEDGVIWRDRVPLDKAASGVSLVADASLRAAAHMTAHASRRSDDPLDKRVQATLRQRYPDGRANFIFNGKSRQHTFDFGIEVAERILLVDAVTPDQSSVASAIVKSLDAQAADAKVVPLFVFDPADHWGSGNLDLLSLGGGRRVELASLGHQLGLMAA